MNLSINWKIEMQTVKLHKKTTAKLDWINQEFSLEF